MTLGKSKGTLSFTQGLHPVYHQRKQHWALLPFVAGVIIGLAVSTILLIRPYSKSVTNNVYINLGQQRHTFGLDPRFAEFDRLLEQLHPYSEMIHRLSEEVKVMDPVFYAVIVPDGQSLDNLKAIRNSWAKDVPEADIGFFVPFDDTARTNFEFANNENTNGIEAESYKSNGIIKLSKSELLEIQTLKFLCDHKLNDTKWFFISYDNVYVKTHLLEKFLLSMETSQSELGYLGKPIKREPIGRVCMPGPGSVLSYSILSELCPKLDACVKLQDHLETECVLGECVRKQLPSVQCAKEGNPLELFLKFEKGKRGSIVDPRNKRVLENALTVYPIADPKLMYNVHQFVVSKRLNTSQHEIQELKMTVDRMAEHLPQTDIKTFHGKENNDVINSEDDIAAWKLINHNMLMSCVENNPASKIQTLWKNELDVLSSIAMEYLNAREEDTYSFKRMVNVYWRVNPLLGTEYILDFEVKLAGTESDYNAPSKSIRATLTRLYNEPEGNPILPEAETSRHVCIGVLVTSELVEKFQRFISMLEKVLEENQRFDLIVVEMRTTTEKQNLHKSNSLKSIVSSYENKYPKANFKVINSPNILSRSHGISLLVRELRPNDLVFISDLDLEFDTSFLDRCRNYPFQGRQVFFPIPFSKMDPSLVASMNHTMLENTITQHSGHWSVNSYSTACIYAVDILSNVQQDDFKGIPNEINMAEVYSTLVKKGYEVVRGVDKGLKRLHSSERVCDLDFYGEQHDPCSSPQGRYEMLYLKTQLSVLLLDHEGEHAHKKY